MPSNAAPSLLGESVTCTKPPAFNRSDGVMVILSVRISPAAAASTGLRSRMAMTLPQAIFGLGGGRRLKGFGGGACRAQEYVLWVKTSGVRPGAKEAADW